MKRGRIVYLGPIKNSEIAKRFFVILSKLSRTFTDKADIFTDCSYMGSVPYIFKLKQKYDLIKDQDGCRLGKHQIGEQHDALQAVLTGPRKRKVWR